MLSDRAAVKTYRYLRIGIVGVAFLLAVSVAIERSKAGCWQTSVSAYYYTPVRAVFVGGLMAIGLCLIVIKGSTTWEDASLNVAGGFAPVVAFVPTSGVGTCWSLPPEPLPVNPDGSLAEWVVANIDNNVTALLIAGFAGLAAAAVIAMIANRSVSAVARVGERGTRLGLLIALVLLVVGWLLFAFWDDFDTKAHGYAAVAMFAFMALAVGGNAWDRRRARGVAFWLYASIAVLMVLAAVVVFAIGTSWDHGVLALEITEITLFAAFWIVQTVEHWHESVRPVP